MPDTMHAAQTPVNISHISIDTHSMTPDDMVSTRNVTSSCLTITFNCRQCKGFKPANALQVNGVTHGGGSFTLECADGTAVPYLI